MKDFYYYNHNQVEGVLSKYTPDQIHVLKTVQPHFDDVWDDRKKAEIRFCDRDFQVGHILILYNYPANDGRFVIAKITHILRNTDDQIQLAPNYAMLSIVQLSKTTDINVLKQMLGKVQ